MNPKSFEARLKVIDPRFRLRKRGSTIFHITVPDSCVAVYRGNTYTGYRFNLGHLERRNTPFGWSFRYNRQIKEWRKSLVSMKRRGRDELVWLLTASRTIRHRWERQLLKL